MGRIQRKKPTGTKKKKKQGNEDQTAAGLQDDKNGGVKLGSSGEGAVSITKKKTVFAPKKTNACGSTGSRQAQGQYFQQVSPVPAGSQGGA
jgi:hypothetical protein